MASIKNISKVSINNEIYQIKDKTARKSLASEYSASATYAVNDLVIYDGVLYRCKTAVTVGEAFDTAKWEAASIATVLSLYAPIDSAKLTGEPKAPTVDYDKYDEARDGEKIATCAFVMAAINAAIQMDVQGDSLVVSDLDVIENNTLVTNTPVKIDPPVMTIPGK